jgi:hypothetical protein
VCLLISPKEPDCELQSQFCVSGRGYDRRTAVADSGTLDRRKQIVESLLCGEHLNPLRILPGTKPQSSKARSDLHQPRFPNRVVFELTKEMAVGIAVGCAEQASDDGRERLNEHAPDSSLSRPGTPAVIPHVIASP